MFARMKEKSSKSRCDAAEKNEQDSVTTVGTGVDDGNEIVGVVSSSGAGVGAGTGKVRRFLKRSRRVRVKVEELVANTSRLGTQLSPQSCVDAEFNELECSSEKLGKVNYLFGCGNEDLHCAEMDIETESGVESRKASAALDQVELGLGDISSIKNVNCPLSMTRTRECMVNRENVVSKACHIDGSTDVLWANISHDNVNSAAISDQRNSWDPLADPSEDPLAGGVSETSIIRETDTLIENSVESSVDLRTYYHCQYGLPLHQDEQCGAYDSDDEVDRAYEERISNNKLDDYEELSFEEKEFMKMWNAYVRNFSLFPDNGSVQRNFSEPKSSHKKNNKFHEVYSNAYVGIATQRFARQFASELIKKGLRHNFLMHLINLYECGLLLATEIKSCLEVVDKVGVVFILPLVKG